jgi:hypothetical protein
VRARKRIANCERSDIESNRFLDHQTTRLESKAIFDPVQHGPAARESS